MAIEVGSIVEGTVTGITNFGAFIELPGGTVGLVHISEVAEEFVRDVHDFLKEQDKVKVKVLSVDPRGKIGLSIKQAVEKKNPDVRSFRPNSKPNSGGGFRKPSTGGRYGASSASFEDKLSKFLKDSDERLTDLRRKTDAKRGGRGGGRS
ncbi:MAG: RNA-binding protein S1 [Selenomonadaceae bacterium]|nr:RNA-binding protein S1 [Selenomonadaceae bacterium]